MAIASNGEVRLYFESIGDDADPALLLVNGLSSQCINFAEAWCRRFVDEGVRVLRFDNRDVGLSSKLDGVSYTIADMAGDGVAVLDAAGVDRAHVLGLSMGGLIVQRMAIDHRERVRTLTSVMSSTAERDHGQSSPDALAVLLAPPARSRDEYIENHVAAIAVYGSKPEWIDEAETRARAAAAYDRCFHPEGIGRQMLAVAAEAAEASRPDALRALDVPTLVMHGSRDTLIDPSGGRRTAELIPGARYHEIDGMGHDYPPAVWDELVSTWAAFVRESTT